MKATDAGLVSELCQKRSRYLDALDPPVIMHPIKGQPAAPPKPLEFYICRHSDGEYWSLGVLPPEFARIYFTQKLAEVERELLQLGVTL